MNLTPSLPQIHINVLNVCGKILVLLHTRTGDGETQIFLVFLLHKNETSVVSLLLSLFTLLMPPQYPEGYVHLSCLDENSITCLKYLAIGFQVALKTTSNHAAAFVTSPCFLSSWNVVSCCSLWYPAILFRPCVCLMSFVYVWGFCIL